MEITVKKTSVQKQVDGVGIVFNIADAFVTVDNGKVESANGSLYRHGTGEYAGSFNYSPGNSSVQVNNIADISSASLDAAGFVAAVEAAEVSDPTNVEA